MEYMPILVPRATCPSWGSLAQGKGSSGSWTKFSIYVTLVFLPKIALVDVSDSVKTVRSQHLKALCFV